jgi:TnpA family transposase
VRICLVVLGNWDEICRLTASLRAGTVIPSAILRTLQRGPSPSSLARALAELGRVIKTLHVLEYAHDPACRRTIYHLLSRGERRNSLARAVFHGQRGQLRRHYQAGQENQFDRLGIMIIVIGHPTINLDGRYRTTNRPPATGLGPLRIN